MMSLKGILWNHLNKWGPIFMDCQFMGMLFHGFTLCRDIEQDCFKFFWDVNLWVRGSCKK